MLIDWISMVYEVQTEADRELVARLSQDRDVCVRLSHGEVRGEWFPRESKRSDSHQISFGLTRNRITIDGSPARLFADSNVFGPADPRECATAMLQAVAKSTGVLFPALGRWRLTRLDATQNYDCGSLANVRIALDSMTRVVGGHAKPTVYENGVTWNKGSDLWRIKAYAKGPHLLYQFKRKQADATGDQLELANRLLRIEWTLANRLIKRLGLSWSRLTRELVEDLFMEHVSKLVPVDGADLTNEQQLTEALIARFGVRYSRPYLSTWGLIKTLGFAAARESMPRRTWFRHQSAFLDLGLSLADLSTGTVLPFRPRSIIARPVDSWDQLRRAA